MMIINNLKELKEYGTLKYNDTLIFGIENIEYEYKVLSNHLQSVKLQNGIIFDVLEIKDKHKFCLELYGYDHFLIGNWPFSKEQDYEALTRVVEAIYKIIEEEEKTEKYLCLKTVSRFELMDFD